jgi:prepilin-type processing-associated H-X9-DG protein
VVADGGAVLGGFCTGTLAYPDLCHLECASAVPIDLAHWQADWEKCPWSQECGAIADMKLDANLRLPYARHHGGVNIGFLDGHAAWWNSEEVVAQSPTTPNPQRGTLRGYDAWGPTKDNPYDPYIPPLY